MKNVDVDFKKRKNEELVAPIFLYAIQYDKVANSWLRYTSYPEDITFDGLLYTAGVISHDRMGENLDGRVDKVRMSIGNADRTIGYYLETYGGLRDAEVRITMVFKDELSNPSVYDESVYLVADATANQQRADFVLASRLDVLDLRLPRRRYYRTYCTHFFKDSGCAYSGGEGLCNKTLQRCIEIGNVHRFGGCPAIPQKTIFVNV